MRKFLKKNKNKKAVVLDIPLFLENKLNKKDDYLIFINSKINDIKRKINNRNSNLRLIKMLRKFQIPKKIKKKKADFIIYNNFRKKKVQNNVKIIKNIILKNERNNSWYRNNWPFCKGRAQNSWNWMYRNWKFFTNKKYFHCYLNPQRKVSQKALEVHGYTDEFLSNKKFSEIADDFLNFIENKRIVIHNAEFDIAHLNNELELAGKRKISINDTLDTLEIARDKFPGSGVSLRLVKNLE